ncbi:DUF3106 domain-containing protein [Xanthomonas theicola]|uniref:Exodeoxyribonuclease VII large subunit n=1 Tax=Xanthomonas theicola TaxID=56464 RepID=A0A2S6ZEE7_9XANT|nr:DUF3106 domain-containing protein [Xanthomonas theicola]PPT90645.1 exodeoxyribonuclease VII large subunit [Xanthomonas theicola]QNH26882.1 DUF3106 domain-containing protein [Xanthomonas theicola]
MNRLIRMFLALALLAGAPLAAFTAPPPPPLPDADTGPPLPDWEHLSAQQRELLIAPMRQRWDDAPQQRRRMFEHAQRWQTMTPEQRARARKGALRYQDMTPQQREAARVLFERLRALPPQQRRALRDRWDAMTPPQRDAWIKANTGTGTSAPRRDRPRP